MKKTRNTLLFTALVALCCRAGHAAATFTPLGDLPGGAFYSAINYGGISADGAVVVGDSNSASGPEAFRWTLSGGMVGLGDLPRGPFNSEANGVSADGSVVVGWGTSASGETAFRWSANALDADDRILYDLPTGILSYDADGNGAGAAVQFARIGPWQWLTHDNFRII